MPSGSIGSIARTIIVLPSHMIAVGMRVMSGSGQARPSRRAAIKSDSPLNSDIACFECFFGIGQLQTSWAPAVNLRSDPERLPSSRAPRAMMPRSAADEVMRRILQTYEGPDRDVHVLVKELDQRELDMLQTFSQSCRRDLDV